MAARDDFREAVFARDGHRCVVCGVPAVDAHHLIERRLWPDGGYLLDNGASLCAVHHLAAEATTLSVGFLRERAGITCTVVPDHLYDGVELTKWGDVVLDDGTRTPGELFWDPSVQKVLRQGGVLGLYRQWVKHPKSMHLPWSASVDPEDGDAIQSDLSLLMAGEVVVTEKLDGEQTTMYSDYLHARSVDSTDPSNTRDWVKNLRAQVGHDIPAGWRVCGENVYGVHSIRYEELSSWFYVHSMWNGRNEALSFDETVEWAALLGLEVVPVLYRGPWDRAAIEACWSPAVHDTQEGYVVRSAAGFPMSEFSRRVAKFVRPNHVQTTKHWMRGQRVEVNGRRDG
jgi:hypothetical protein